MEKENLSSVAGNERRGGRAKSLVIAVALIVMLSLILGITLTACNDTVKWTVSYTGEGVTTPSEIVINGGTAMKPASPTRDGYMFTGWLLNGVPFDFSTPITGDITLTAGWEVLLPSAMTGTGIKQDPYVLWTANDLINFSSRVNAAEVEGNRNFYNAYFKLGTDIDMSGIRYTPAGRISSYDKTVIDPETGEESVQTVNIFGFEGVFDGNGHKISNLSINQNLRQGTYYVGFFGITNEAIVSDVTFENINYVVESGADTDSIGANVGGVAGVASDTVLMGVHVTGKIEARLCATNSGHIGGLAGSWEIGGGKYAFAENCFANVEITPGKFSDDDAAATPDNAIFGGLFARVYNMSSAAAIINSASAGKTVGGNISGGLVGYAAAPAFSIVNCVSSMTVQVGSKTDNTYAGGLLGFTRSDVLIMDSLYIGTVVGTKPSAAEKDGYAGAIVGYCEEDTYDIEYEAGIAVVNTYYKANVSTCDVKTQKGISLPSNANPDITWAKTQLGWDEAIWTGTDSVRFIPTSAYAAQIHESFTLTLDGGSFVEMRESQSGGKGSYGYVGLLDRLPARSDYHTFWDWELEDGVRYRYYMPIVKDIELTAKWFSTESVAGLYTGTATLNESIDAGILELMRDGTLQWVQSGTLNGTYSTDGNHLIMHMFSGSLGDIACTIDGEDLTFKVSAGMTGDVTYEMKKSDLRYFGEYYSEDGDMLGFTGESGLVLNSFKINAESVKGTFTLDPDNDESFSVSGGALTSYFSSMTVEYVNAWTIRVNFVGKNSYPSINTTFSKLGDPDYTGKKFVGRWTVSYASNYEPFRCDKYILTLNADGSASVTSPFSETEGRYYAFGDKIRLDYDGYISMLTYYGEQDVLFGIYNRGTSSKRDMVCIRIEGDTDIKDLDFRCYIIDPNTYDSIHTSNYPYVKTAVYKYGEKAFYVENGEFKPDAVITGSFEDNGTVIINGQKYIVVKKTDGNVEGRSLVRMGDENGMYSYKGGSLSLNGIGYGLLNGEPVRYWVYDTRVVVLADNDEVFAFDYTSAKAAGNAVTALEHDGYQGVWYSDKEATASSKAEKKYYKLVLDGFGHTATFYIKEGVGYSFNWGGGWGTYAITPGGVRTMFNASQVADFSFYYDMKLAYSRSFVSEKKPRSFYKNGYTGSLEPPALPLSAVGRYTGEESDGTQVVFNLREDLTGSYKGAAYIAVFDGDNIVRFTIGSVQYAFNITTKTLVYGSENVALALGGEVTEVIPSAICGEYSGTVDGYGGSRQVTLTISTEGAVAYDTMTFTVSYDITSNVISGIVGDNSITIRYNSVDGTITVYASIGGYTYNGTMTKTA